MSDVKVGDRWKWNGPYTFYAMTVLEVRAGKAKCEWEGELRPGEDRVTWVGLNIIAGCATRILALPPKAG